jgi:hypothetical protein
VQTLVSEAGKGHAQTDACDVDMRAKQLGRERAGESMAGEALEAIVTGLESEVDNAAFLGPHFDPLLVGLGTAVGLFHARVELGVHECIDHRRKPGDDFRARYVIDNSEPVPGDHRSGRGGSVRRVAQPPPTSSRLAIGSNAPPTTGAVGVRSTMRDC